MTLSLAIVVINGVRKLSGSTSRCGENIALQSNIVPQILMVLTSVIAGNSLQMRKKIKNMSSLQNILHEVKHTNESNQDCCQV